MVLLQAANHSSVNFAAPNFGRYPAYAQALACQLAAELQVITSAGSAAAALLGNAAASTASCMALELLCCNVVVALVMNEMDTRSQAGDAIFIPEGWWHQIDSTDVTIAVNFWWQSPCVMGLQVCFKRLPQFSVGGPTCSHIDSVLS